ncbi:MAG: hypothetical protein ACLRWP_16905 [Bilophila wadsworthia]
MSRGYHNKPEKNAEAFVPIPSTRLIRPMALPHRRRGADARHRRPEFLGREDHQINLRGYRIEAGEIARCASTSP